MRSAVAATVMRLMQEECRCRTCSRISQWSEDWVHHYPDALNQDDDETEWMLPVRWIDTRPESEAYWEKGMFGNQNSACTLRQEFTLARLAEHFDTESDRSD